MLRWLRKQAERFSWRAKGPEGEAARHVYSDGLPPGVLSSDHPRSLPTPKVPPAGAYVAGRIDPAKQYVGGTPSAYYGNLLQVLPRHIDELTKAWGEDLYERMLYDDQVAASTWSVTHQVISEEIHFRPAVEGKRDEGYEISRLICDYVTRDLEDLQSRSLDMWAEEMFFQAVACGNKLSEKVYEPIEAGRDAGRLGLCKLKTKPRKNVGFVVNQFNDVIGIRAVMPGVQPFALPQATVLDPALLQYVLPRHKFAVLAWRPKDEDPRGSSLLHPAYKPWWEKRQTGIEYLKAIGQFGSPFIWGTPPEGAQPQPDRDEYGNVLGQPVDPVQGLFLAIQRLRAGGAAAFAPGTMLNVLSAGAGIEVLMRAMEAYDTRINKAIRLATRDTEEAQHGSRADSETAQDVVGNLIRAGQRFLKRMVAYDIVYPLVLANWGPEVARRYSPKVAIGGVEHHDKQAMFSSVSSAWSGGILTPSQLAYCQTELLGLPAPEEGELEALVAQKQGAMGGAAPGPMPAGTAAPAGDGTVLGSLPGLSGAAPAAPAEEGGGDLQNALPGLFGG